MSSCIILYRHSLFGIRVCKEPTHHAVIYTTRNITSKPNIAASAVTVRPIAPQNRITFHHLLSHPQHLATNAIHLSSNETQGPKLCPSPSLTSSSTPNPRYSLAANPFYTFISIPLTNTRISYPGMEGPYHPRRCSKGKQVGTCDSRT